MYDVQERLLALRKRGMKVRAVDVVKELNRREIKVNTSEFSLFTTGAADPPKSDLVLAETDKILTEWEEKVCQS